MVKGKIVVFAIAVIIVYFLISMLILNKIKLPAHTTYLVIGFALLLAISAFFPYDWGKILREVSYILLFILIIYVGSAALSPFVQKIEINVTECKDYFIPSKTQEGEVSNIIYNALGYASCILTGYFPANMSNIGWATFFIFYIILPFIFIFILAYYLTKDVLNISNKKILPSYALAILSIIISLYAARTLTGWVILEILGYGYIGLGLIFASLIITNSTKKLIEDWYSVDEAAKTAKQAIEAELNLMKIYGETAKPIIETAKLAAKVDLNVAAQELAKLKNIPQYAQLPSLEKQLLEEMINKAISIASLQGEDKDRNRKQFEEHLKMIEDYVKKFLAKVKTENK